MIKINLFAMRFIFSISLLIFILQLPCCRDTDLYPDIKIKHNPVLSETEFKISGDSCTMALIRYDAGINRGILKYRNQCNFIPTAHCALLKQLLQSVLNNADTGSINTIAWGRLTPNLNFPSIFSQRLALVAHSHAEWNGTRGEPARGHINDYILQVLNSSQVLRELKECFHETGYTIRVSGVEKVQVLPAQSIPGLSQYSGMKLPVDCQIWFSVYMDPN